MERAKASPDFKAWWLGGGLAKSDDLDVLPLLKVKPSYMSGNYRRTNICA